LRCLSESTVESKFEICDLPGSERPYVLRRMGSYSFRNASSLAWDKFQHQSG
jgi:hypothetical protein